MCSRHRNRSPSNTSLQGRGKRCDVVKREANKLLGYLGCRVANGNVKSTSEARGRSFRTIANNKRIHLFVASKKPVVVRVRQQQTVSLNEGFDVKRMVCSLLLAMKAKLIFLKSKMNENDEETGVESTCTRKLRDQRQLALEATAFVHHIFSSC